MLSPPKLVLDCIAQQLVLYVCKLQFAEFAFLSKSLRNRFNNYPVFQFEIQALYFSFFLENNRLQFFNLICKVLVLITHLGSDCLALLDFCVARHVCICQLASLLKVCLQLFVLVSLLE